MIINILIEVTEDDGPSVTKGRKPDLTILPESRDELRRWIFQQFGFNRFTVRDLKPFWKLGSGRQWTYKVLREFERDGWAGRHEEDEPVTWSVMGLLRADPLSVMPDLWVELWRS